METKATKDNCNWLVKFDNRNKEQRIRELMRKCGEIFSVNDVYRFGYADVDGFYGVVNGEYGFYRDNDNDTPVISIDEAEKLFAEPELKFPREMWVRNSMTLDFFKRKIYGIIEDRAIHICPVSDNVYGFKYYKEIEPEPENKCTGEHFKNILTEQSLHSIDDCLKELKFNRPAESQKWIDALIEITKKHYEEY